MPLRRPMRSRATAILLLMTGPIAAAWPGEALAQAPSESDQAVDTITVLVDPGPLREQALREALEGLGVADADRAIVLLAWRDYSERPCAKRLIEEMLDGEDGRPIVWPTRERLLACVHEIAAARANVLSALVAIVPDADRTLVDRRVAALERQALLGPPASHLHLAGGLGRDVLQILASLPSSSPSEQIRSLREQCAVGNGLRAPRPEDDHELLAAIGEYIGRVRTHAQPALLEAIERVYELRRPRPGEIRSHAGAQSRPAAAALMGAHDTMIVAAARYMRRSGDPAGAGEVAIRLRAECYPHLLPLGPAWAVLSWIEREAPGTDADFASARRRYLTDREDMARRIIGITAQSLRDGTLPMPAYPTMPLGDESRPGPDERLDEWLGAMTELDAFEVDWCCRFLDLARARDTSGRVSELALYDLSTRFRRHWGEIRRAMASNP